MLVHWWTIIDGPSRPSLYTVECLYLRGSSCLILKIVWFNIFIISNKIFRFRPESFGFAKKIVHFEDWSSAFARIVCFGPSIVCFRPHSSTEYKEYRTPRVWKLTRGTANFLSTGYKEYGVPIVRKLVLASLLWHRFCFSSGNASHFSAVIRFYIFQVVTLFITMQCYLSSCFYICIIYKKLDFRS